jgi:hypothetical protein
MKSNAVRFALSGALIVSTLALASCGGSPTAPAANASFQGVWDGSWTRTACSETGGAIGSACSQTPQAGALRFTLTQTGSSVQGNVDFGFVIPTTGSVNGSSLVMSGQIHLAQPANATATVSNWSTTRSGNSMTGNFTVTLVADDPAFGSQTLQIALQNMTKSP